MSYFSEGHTTAILFLLILCYTFFMQFLLMPIRRGKAFLTSRRLHQGRIVKRQRISQPCVEPVDNKDQETASNLEFIDDDSDTLENTEDCPVEQECSSRKRKSRSYDDIKRAEIEKWIDLRPKLLNGWTENLIPDKNTCACCHSEALDIFLCPDCDPTNRNPLCKDCLSSKHTTCSLHVPIHVKVYCSTSFVVVVVNEYGNII